MTGKVEKNNSSCKSDGIYIPEAFFQILYNKQVDKQYTKLCGKNKVSGTSINSWGTRKKSLNIQINAHSDSGCGKYKF